MSSKNFYGLTGDVTIDGGILNVANTNVSGNVTSTSLLVSNVATLGTTKTFVVRASGGVYYIDEDPRKSLELHEGQTYIFDLSHSSLASGPHPLEFATQPEGANSSGYTTGISATGTLGTAGAKKTFVVPAGAPTTLYYYCTAHTGMGGQINISPAAELVVSGRIVASGNVEASKITASANVEVTGNVVASKFVGDGSLLTSVTAATTSGLQVVTDNSPTTTNTIEFTNPTTSLRASSNIVATGNVTADHFIGDGSRLSGIVTSVTFGDAVDTGNISSNTLLLTNVKEGLVATGNVVTQGKFIGDGSELTGIVTSVNLSDAVDTGNTTSNTVQFTNTSTSLTASGNVEVTGNVVATYFVGDGSRLTNLPGGSGGSGTSHWTKTTGTDELHYSAGNVGISNTSPAHDLSIGSNLYVDDDASDGVLMVTGNVHGTYFVGDGSRLINLPEGGGSTNWTTSGSPVNKIYYPQNPGTTSVSVGIMNAAPTHTLSVGSNLFIDDTASNVLVVDGDISAESMFLGALGIKPSYPLDTVTDAGNVTPHTISFTNPTLGITTASNVEIGGALVVGKGTLGGSNLEVGEANLFVNTQLTRVGIATDQPAATLHVNGSLAVDGPLTFGTVNVAAQHGLEAITAVSNTTPLTIELQNADTSLVTTGNVEVGGDLTVTGNVTTDSELIVAGNVFYTNLMSVSVKSNMVTEYTGPHDRPLRKYPEVALTADAETVSGYKGYKVTASDDVDNNSNLDKFRAFNGITGNEAWGSGGSKFTGGVAIVGGDSLGNVEGQWLKLQLPLKIKLSHIKLTSRDIAGIEYPKDFQILGSNDDSNWTQLINVVDAPYTQHLTLTHHVTGTVDSFQYLAVVVTKTHGGTGVTISELEYYGYEEGSGSLDTTLKSVYNVPATTGTQLEVYYDGQNYTSGTTVNDLAGTATNATITNTDSAITFDSTYKAWTFGGTDTRTSNFQSSALPSTFSGDQVHSVALWFKCDVVSGDTLFSITQPSDPWEDPEKVISVRFNDESGGFRYLFWSNDTQYHGTDANISKDIWYHLCVTYSGGGGTTENKKLYLNGNEIHHTSTTGTYFGNNLSLPSGSVIRLGSRVQETTRFFGSIANFRLYSKALNADQVKELYDYQKDYFLGSKSQVTLYKGHLGVGVTEPSGQLELAGDERLQEYPPRGMTDYDTHIEGHGVFCAYGSSYYTATNYGWSPFDKNQTSKWASQNAQNYNGTGQTYSGSRQLGTDTVKGEYVILKLPYKIKLKSTKILTHTPSSEAVKDFIIYGSNDGSTWSPIFTKTSDVYNSSGTFHDVNSTHFYDRFAIVCTRTNGSTWIFALTEWCLFGTPGPTTLDKGSLSLTRSLDVPRVSRYDVDTETPRPEKLVVHFDTTVNATPTDISGKGRHGSFKNDATYSAPDKAFKFAAANAHIYLEQNALSGTSATNTFSLWINALSAPGSGNYECIFEGGVRSGNQAFGLYVYQHGSNTRLYYHTFGSNLPSETTGYIINTDRWYHICGTLFNGGSNSGVRRFYVNGELFASDTYGSLNITHPRIRIGENVNGSESWHGLVSNFKLYNVALEPSEVRKLYNLGRTGRSMVISDTAVGIGRAPEAQLDVRGTLAVRGRVGVGTSSPNAELHVVGASGQLTSAQHYGFASGGPATNYGTGIHNTVSIYGNDDIVAGGYVLSHAGTMASSDERIKKEIVDIEDGEALSTLRLLKPKQYKYRDDVKRGTEPVWGFIAQEVSATLPYATQLRRETVPNIYELANVSDSNVITFTNFDTSTLESNVFNIKVFDTENNEHTVNLTEVINERSIRVNKDLSKWTANVMTGNQIFVYGQQVDDFTFLKKDAIWTVATAALQEVDRQLQNEKIRNDTLETQVSDLLERVAALENA